MTDTVKIIGLVVLGLFGLYIASRIISAGYFKSKSDYTDKKTRKQ